MGDFKDWVTSKDAASAYGVTRQRVQRLCFEGKVRHAKSESGKILLDPITLSQCFKTPKIVTKPKPKIVTKPKPKIVTKPKPKIVTKPKDLPQSGVVNVSRETLDPPPKGPKYLESKLTPVAEAELSLKLEKLRAQELSNSRVEGSLINKEQEKLKWFQIGRDLRNSVEAIPDRISVLCVGLDAHEIKTLMVSELKKSLMNIKEEI